MNRQIRTIDCHYIRTGIAASFLVHEDGEGYFVEANTCHALPHLLRALEEEGVGSEKVRWIAVTHAHLDHAGGALALLDACPEASVLAHPRAARHLIDPDKLVSSAKKVYGERAFAELYGDIRPIPADRVRIVEDGDEIPFKGGSLRCIYTRGHANHHFCLVDPVLDGVFTGDSFGLAYPVLQRNGLFIFPSTSPTDFDPNAALETLDIISNAGVRRVFLTHFGELTDPIAARSQLREFLNFSGMLYEEAISGTEGFEALSSRFEAELRKFFEKLAAWTGLLLTPDDWELLATDLRLNADGIAFAGIKARGEQPAGSTHGRHGKIGPAADAAGPTGRDGLLSRIKMDPFRSMHVQVSQQRPFPSAEAVESHGHGEGDIDAHHSRLDPGGEFPGSITVAGENGGAVSERVVINQAQSAFEVWNPDDG